MYEHPGKWPDGGVRGWLFVNEIGAYPVKREWILRSPQSWKDRFVNGRWRLMSDYGRKWCLAHPKEDPLSRGRSLPESLLDELGQGVTL